MKKPKLEERIAALEREVAELKKSLAWNGGVKDYRSTYGMFSGDEVMKRIDEAALKYREKDREKARQRNSKRRRTKA